MSTAKYAAGTSVPADRSRAELERLLVKYGADGFTTGFAENKAHVMFRMKNRMIRIAHIILPNRQTAGQHMIPQIAAAYDKGTMPKLLE